MHKKKIVNDPLYGFISIQTELAFEIIQHPLFQRLRHISQLGLAHFVYPGAKHSRFQHALGAYHLMGKAIESLKSKGVEISDTETEAATLAVLLHDIGHGPFSHSLEETLLPDIKHESLTFLFIQKLNKAFGDRLDLAMRIFRNGYHRKFFHQLVNSQLDVDRLDYLKRDSYFTGVQEGNVGVDRIIDMLNVVNDKIVIEEKGIYSVENFLTSRRLMYWQVYLHKTSVSAERLLVNIIRRAKYLAASGEEILGTNSLLFFLKHYVTLEDFKSHPSTLDHYGQLDDHDVWGAIKLWKSHRDPILSMLCTMIVERNLFKIKLSSDPINKKHVERVKEKVMDVYELLNKDANYLFSYGTVVNEAYAAEGQLIRVLSKNGDVVDLSAASDFPLVKAMSKSVKKNFLCWPRNIDLT
jgi:uncharacterized protein